MEHFLFLINLATLFVGLLEAGFLWRAWRKTRRPLDFWRLVHFSGFTFTMAAAALDAYGLVTLGLGPGLTRLWTAWVLVGASVMLFAFPHLSRLEAGRGCPPRFRWFWGLCTLVPLTGALLVLRIEDFTTLLWVLGLSFLPFWVAIVYGLVLGTRSGYAKPREGWGVFLTLLLLGGAEVSFVLLLPPQKGYYFVTLPLAYLYTVWASRQQRHRAPQLIPAIPEVLGREFGLTPRERQMAEGILRALSNKELAADLGLSENTVRNHISNLYRKLGIQKRLDLVVLVQKYQVTEPLPGTKIPSS